MRRSQLVSILILASIALSHDCFAQEQEEKKTAQEQGEETAPPDKEKDNKEIVKDGWNFGPLPCISYNSDLGFQYGVCADIFNYKGVFPDYRQRFYVEASRYTGGQTLAHAQFDSRYLIPKIRTTFSASYQYDPMFLFYGISGLEKYRPEMDSNKETRTAYYNYKRWMVRVLTNFQGPIVPGLEWTAGLNFWSYGLGDIDMEKKYDSDNTLYHDMKEAGVFKNKEAEGGSLFELSAGLVYDTRDNQSAPLKGIWGEVFFMGSPDVFGTGYNYLKLAAHFRQYISLGTDRVVLAYHLAYQGIIAGQAPFYHQQSISTLYLRQTCTDGLGGINTIRGMMAQRLVGDNYFWGNLELRVRLFNFNLFKQSWYVATNPFLDGGMLTRLYKGEELSAYYNRPIEELKKDALRFHTSAGIGLKLAMNRNFIVSAEYARPFSSDDGTNTVYVALNYIF